MADPMNAAEVALLQDRDGMMAGLSLGLRAALRLPSPVKPFRGEGLSGLSPRFPLNGRHSK